MTEILSGFLKITLIFFSSYAAIYLSLPVANVFENHNFPYFLKVITIKSLNCVVQDIAAPTEDKYTHFITAKPLYLSGYKITC